MLLYVYDKTITLLGIVEEITSLVWTEKKYTYGTFQALLPITDDNIAILQKGRLIIRDDDTEKQAGEILYKHTKKTANGSEVLEITGKLLPHWLNDRLIINAINATAKPQALIRSAVGANAVVASAGVTRGFPLLVLGTQTESRQQTPLNYKNEERISVLAMCEETAAATDTGFNITVDTVAKQFRFNTYTGVDHTISNNSPCIFSVEYENILEQEFTESVENLKNVAYVFGEDDSPATMPVIVGAAAGHNRKEVYVNASSVKQEDLTNAEYEAVLATNGGITLQQYTEAQNFYSKINTAAGGFKYGEDYQLGDKVTCVNTKWGVSIDAVITEVQTTYKDGQKVIYLTFGDALPTLFDKLKNLKKR